MSTNPDAAPVRNPAEPSKWPEFALWSCTGGTAAALLALLVTSLRAPFGYHCLAGLYPFDVPIWCRALHIPRPGPISTQAFVHSMTTLLAIAWTLYGIAIVAALQSRNVRPRRLFAFGAIVAIIFAVVVPPTVSGDTGAYVCYGRIQAIHHQNPYMTPTSYLFEHGDSFVREMATGPSGSASVAGPLNPGRGPVVYWSGATYYGPVWTAICGILALLFGGLPAVCQIMAYKLVAAAGLIGAAWAAGMIAGAAGSRAARVAATAGVLFNPLLLIEGPGEGHNDLLTMALFLIAVMLAVNKKYAGSGFLVGLSAGVKLFPMLLGPWLALGPLRPGDASDGAANLQSGEGRTPHGLPSSRRRVPIIGAEGPGLRNWAVYTACALIPLLLGYGSYWSGSSTFSSLHSSVAVHARSPIPTLAVYAIMTVRLALSRDRLELLLAWVPVALMLALWNAQSMYPWYLSWAILPTLCRYTPVHLGFIGFLSLFAFCWQVIWYLSPIT